MITLFTKPNCPYCEQAKSWLTKNSIDYTIIDISQDELARDMLREAGHRTVPQIYLYGEVFVEGGYTGLSKQDPHILKEQIEKRKVAA
jgi:glutaredoxin